MEKESLENLIAQLIDVSATVAYHYKDIEYHDYEVGECEDEDHIFHDLERMDMLCDKLLDTDVWKKWLVK
jgi:hypothetical protein